jgi:hypothetical protein
MYRFLKLLTHIKSYNSLNYRAKLTYSTIGPVGPVPRLKISHVSTLTFTTNGVSVGKKISSLFHLSSLTSAPLFLRPPWPKAPNLQTHEATTTTKNPETHGA